jgi:hypothetical protein
MPATAALSTPLTVQMFFLWRFLGFRRLLVLLLLRLAWRMVRAIRQRRRTARAASVDASA